MDLDYEPMDVDLSGSSIRHIDAMDISFNDSNVSSHSSLGIKVKEEPIDTHNEDYKGKFFDNEINTVRSPIVIKRYSLQRKDQKKSLSNATLSVIVTIICLVTLIIYHIVKFECSNELDLQLLKNSLTENIIGQPEAIEHIIESLEEKSRSKILIFYGGTGVGKTLTTSLILGNLHHYANIYHYTMPSFSDTFSTDLMLGLNFCPTSLIIVDDLQSIDVPVIEKIKRVIEKSENLNKNITIILVFNCDTINNQYLKKCDSSFSTDLQKAFMEIKALKRIIKFNSLNEKDLQRCIEKELGNKVLRDEEFENIVKNFDVSVDGCKSVYRKIKLLNIN